MKVNVYCNVESIFVTRILRYCQGRHGFASRKEGSDTLTVRSDAHECLRFVDTFGKAFAGDNKTGKVSASSG